MERRIITTDVLEEDVKIEGSLRPQHLDDYIGQEKTKKNLKVYIEAAKQRSDVLDHVLFYGPPGLGKTTLSGIIANEMGVHMKVTSGPAIEKPGEMAAILNNLQEGDVLFVDEIHRLNRQVEEVLYPAMEDFAIDIMLGKESSARSIRLDLPHFTLVGATTRAGLLTAPLRDRFGVVQKLEFYTPGELQIIVERSAEVLGIGIEPEGAAEIARRSRGTPRLANRLLKRVRDFAQVKYDGVITKQVAAFALPMLDRLTANAPRRKGAVRALILTPTRELALQIGESFEAYGKYLKLRSTVIFGGVGQAPQVEAIRKGVDILIACPGRLNDLIGQGFIDLSALEIFVLDEADRMLDMGFVHDVKKVIAKLPAKRQNLMFSATMPKEIEQLAAGILHDPAFVKVDPVSSTVERIDQSLYFVEKGNKKFLLPWLIKNLTPPVQNALVFSRTKHGADKIARDLTKQGITAAAIHGNKSQTARVAALEGFKEGKTRVLVATDIAARGIDISELSHVFNYDLPEVPETYVHRIGRTARAGADGTAVSFCAPEEMEYLAGIEKLNRRKIPVVSGHPWDGVPAPVKAAPPVRGRKPKAEQPAPEKAETPKAEKAARPAAPEKKSAAKPSAAKKQKAPKIEAKEERLMDDNKRTPGGRDNSRRNNNNRPRREGNAPAQGAGRGSNAQPKFDPHFVSAPEATPLRSAKKNAATPAAPVQTIPTAMQNRQPAQRSENNGRNGAGRSPRNERNDRSARPAQPAQQNSQRNENRNGRSNNHNEQSGAGRASRAPKAEQSGRNNRSRSNNVPTKDEDPGLVLISRRPPQQKYTSFEEYMDAHGGATAPIEDHSEEV